VNKKSKIDSIELFENIPEPQVNTDTEEEQSLTPQESLYRSFQEIQKSIYSEIIQAILSKSPREFERLVVSLLQKMGYGGEIKSSGTVTQYSNDKGIDGVIKEDVLGLGRIYIQAKRYDTKSTIGREDIQKFVGALAVAQSKKGVFILSRAPNMAHIDIF